jgi:cytochrome c oxidase subunit 3
MSAALHVNTTERKYKIHPKMFLLYIAMASMIMFFSSLTSAVIVKRGDIKHWQEVLLPGIFFISTIVIAISSFTIQMAKISLEDKAKFQFYSLITLVLSFVFVACQWMGWNQLKAQDVNYVGNPSGSYIYFISFAHAFHYIFGILFLFILNRTNSAKSGQASYSLNFKILTQYWHFIGIIWVYLFILFKFIIYK